MSRQHFRSRANQQCTRWTGFEPRQHSLLAVGQWRPPAKYASGVNDRVVKSNGALLAVCTPQAPARRTISDSLASQVPDQHGRQAKVGFA